MRREILFRGKRKDNGEWMYGDFQQNVDCVKIREKEKGKEPSFETSQGIKEGGRIARSFQCIPETIGQYTGLNDSYGNKIFEGDIVELEEKNKGEKFKAIVEFGNPNGEYNWGYQLHPVSNVPVRFDILLWVEMEESGAYIKVISNIYDDDASAFESDEKSTQ